MATLILSFFSSFLATLIIVRLRKFHGHFSLDNDFDSPQKFHKIPVPRIGGISILIGISFGTIYRSFHEEGLNNLYICLLLSAAPTFIIGFLEDITKTVSVIVRLFFTAFGAAIFVYLTQAKISSIDFNYINFIFNIPFFSVLFTIFAIVGLSNAYNIIDGFNGLASMIGIIALGSIAYISLITGDYLIVFLCLIMIGAITGFFIWNYPSGNIFLGDGGAYLIGFWVACLSILIVTRQNSISPWFAFLVNAYPIVETVFTIFRRSIHKKRSAHKPDGIHLHSLIYRRVLNPYAFCSKTISINSKTAPYLWAFSVLSIVPAVVWWNNTLYLILASLFFSVFYVWLFSTIVRFKVPSWLKP